MVYAVFYQAIDGCSALFAVLYIPDLITFCMPEMETVIFSEIVVEYPGRVTEVIAIPDLAFHELVQQGSGIKAVDDARRVAACGADALLVGETLMRSGNILVDLPALMVEKPV